MIEIRAKLFVGNGSDCRVGDDKWAVIHACKSPCHQRAIGYRGSLSTTHPNYLDLKRGTDLYLNLIDPPIPLFQAESFIKFLRFAKVQLERGMNILIHCNQGESRAPSLAILLLAKHMGEISNESYLKARADFEVHFPGYNPGGGIQKYLAEHWDEFDEF